MALNLLLQDLPSCLIVLFKIRLVKRFLIDNFVNGGLLVA